MRAKFTGRPSACNTIPNFLLVNSQYVAIYKNMGIQFPQSSQPQPGNQVNQEIQFLFLCHGEVRENRKKDQKSEKSQAVSKRCYLVREFQKR
jgi:hypothetical protein